MKHMAAYNEGFHPCNLWPAPTIPPPSVSLRDARLALEQAQAFTSERSLNRGLELANDALNLCIRVTENQCHPMAIDCIDLMAAIFHEAEDYPMAAMHAEKGLSLTIQSSGFDMTSVVTAHLTLYTISLKLRELDRAVKHLLAALYLIDVMAGPLHIEAHTSYHKLGNIYMDKEYEGKYMSTAVRCFKEASKRDGYDRLMEGITSMHVARALAGMDEYKDAVVAQKEAVRVISIVLGREHDWTKECTEELHTFERLAAQKGTKHVESANLAVEAARADAAAAELLASSVEEKVKNKSKNKKKKGKR
jgi:tetratricopeptide (TPR) repeat protein